jgi:hypothetical protein
MAIAQPDNGLIAEQKGASGKGGAKFIFLR